jgi:hypothetical protein
VSRTIISYAATAAVTLAAAIAAAQTPWRLEHIGGWGGPVTEIVRDGDIAYVATGQRIVTLDMSDPNAPVEIGGLNMGMAIQDLVLRDDYIVTSVSRPNEDPAEFAIVYVGDPASPEVSWSYDGGFFVTNANGEIQVYEHDGTTIAYYGTSATGAFAVDITDLANPQVIGEMPSYFRVSAAEIVGSYLINAGGSLSKLIVYDLSNPVKPVIVTQFPVYDGAMQVIVEDGVAYVIGRDTSQLELGIRTWLQTYNVSDPTSPVLIDSFLVTDNSQPDLGGRAVDLDVRNGVVYVALRLAGPLNPSEFAQMQGLVIINATDPADMYRVGTYKTRADILGVRVDPEDPTRVYAFDQGEGLLILDVSDPAQVTRAGSFFSPGSMPDMARDGDLLYVSDRWNGFSILDVSEPANPSVVGVYQTREESIAGGNWGIDVKDGIVAISTGWAGFEIVDVSNPTQPQFLGTVSEPWPDGVQAGDLKLNMAHDDILHVGTQPGAWLVTFDISDPANITDISALFLDGSNAFVRDIESTSGGTVVHLVQNLAIQAVNVEYPENPSLLSSFTHGGITAYADLALNEDGQGGVFRYVTEYAPPGTGIFVQDVTDPANPGPAEFFNPAGLGVAISNARLFQARSNEIVQAFDIGTPMDPIHLADGPAVMAANAGANGAVGVNMRDRVLAISDSWDDQGPPTSLELTGMVILELVCPNDFNGDGVLNILDFVAYQGAFVMQDDDADINGDGVLNILDFVAFQEIFKNGCP